MILNQQLCGCPPGLQASNFVGLSSANACGAPIYLAFMTILQNYINRNCEISQPCQRIIPKTEPDKMYDFIVVGAGSAGPVVANRLSENQKWKVLILEAGDDEPNPAQVPSFQYKYNGTAADWQYVTEPQTSACLGNVEQRCKWPRGKMLGGCSSLNGMMYMRGVPRDYDLWQEEFGLEGWRFDDVFPYFLKSEDNRQIGTLVSPAYHATGGYWTTQRYRHHPQLSEDLLVAGDELGYGHSDDLNGAQKLGFAIAQTNNRDGQRLSSSKAFLWSVRERSNLHVMVNSTVTKVIIDDATNIARGVTFIYNGITYVVRASKEVILAAGAVNSPQLLLLSGVGPRQHLEDLKIRVVKDLPGVGENLQNHVAFSVPYILDKVPNYSDLNSEVIKQYLSEFEGPMSGTGMMQMTARLNSKYADPDGLFPDMQLFFGGYLAECSYSGAKHELRDSNVKKRFSAAPLTLRPESRGTIRLQSKNPLVAPLIQPNYLTRQYDVDVLIEATKVAVSLQDSPTLQRKYGIRVPKDEIGNCFSAGAWGTDAYWECAIRYATGPENHQAGSCKMGNSSDEMAVLDAQLRVYGIKGLRVMDASVMPRVVSGNIAATIMMIAEKGADYIKQTWSFSG